MGDYINIALNKPTSQSSYSLWETGKSSQSAVDGKITGGFAFHTICERNPWWLVDLEGIYFLSRVVIWNRENNLIAAERARPMRILISKDQVTWKEIAFIDFVFGGKLSNTPLAIGFRKPIEARYLKIQLEGKQCLHLDEVEIYTTPKLLEFVTSIRNPSDKTPFDKTHVEWLRVFFESGRREEVVPVFWKGIAHPVHLRRGTSDWLVFEQIFLVEEYGMEFGNNIANVIDLGAYIGLSAVYFANRYSTAKIICVEPDADNWQMLCANTQYYPNISAIHAGVWSRRASLEVVARETGDWGNIVRETADGTGIPAVAISDIVTDYGLESIDLLKVDIEGSEKEVFSGRVDDWLGKVKAVVCELHDRIVPGCTESYHHLFKNDNFVEVRKGENVGFVRK